MRSRSLASVGSGEELNQQVLRGIAGTKMMQRVTTIVARFVSVACLSVAGALFTNVPAALAQTCAVEAISARGDFSRFEWSARAKARASWRRKVRLNPDLGVAYSDWNEARDREVRCIKSERSVYCMLSAKPCRK